MKKLLVAVTLLALIAISVVVPMNTSTHAGGYIQSITPVIHDGIVVTGIGDGGLFGLNASDGKQVWKIETTDRVYSSPELEASTGKVYAVLGTEIFPYRHLHKIDAKTGDIEWRMPVTKGVFGQPLVQDGYVIVPTTGINAGKGTVEAYKTDGTFLWSYWFGGWSVSKPLIIDDCVLAASFFGQIEIIQLKNGKKSSKWKKPFQTEGSGPYPWNEKDSAANRNGAAIECDLALQNGHIYIGSYDSHLYKIDPETGVKAGDGFEIHNAEWSHKVRWARSTPLSYNGAIYAGCQSDKSETNGLYKFEDGTFKKLGQYVFSSRDAYVNSTPVEVNGKIIFGTDTGNVICVEEDLGDALWITNITPNYLSNRPAVDGDKLFFTARKVNDQLKTLCIDANNGDIVWEKIR